MEYCLTSYFIEDQQDFGRLTEFSYNITANHLELMDNRKTNNVSVMDGIANSNFGYGF